MIRIDVALPLSVVLLSAASLHAQAPAPAPYTRPDPGTRYVYSGLVNTITRNDGWRTYFRDARGNEGVRIGTFIPDNPKSPLRFDAAALARLWPLRVGARTELETRRGPLVWKWRLAVVDTETVTVPAGTFQTYVVETSETPVVTARRDPSLVATTFWYAPALGAVVRFKSGQLVGTTGRTPIRQELLEVGRGEVARRP